MPVGYKHRFCYKKAIKSILDQNIQDFFVVIMADGFDLEPCIDDNRFLFRKTDVPDNTWGTVPRNEAIKYIDKSKSYLCYLDADNEWFPEHLSVCKKAMDDGYDLSCTGFYRVDSYGNVENIDSEENKLCRIDSNGICINIGNVNTEEMVWESVYEHDFVLFDKLYKNYYGVVIKNKTFLYWV